MLGRPVAQVGGVPEVLRSCPARPVGQVQLAPFPIPSPAAAAQPYPKVFIQDHLYKNFSGKKEALQIETHYIHCSVQGPAGVWLSEPLTPSRQRGAHRLWRWEYSKSRDLQVVGTPARQQLHSASAPPCFLYRWLLYRGQAVLGGARRGGRDTVAMSLGRQEWGWELVPKELQLSVFLERPDWGG